MCEMLRFPGSSCTKSLVLAFSFVSFIPSPADSMYCTFIPGVVWFVSSLQMAVVSQIDLLMGNETFR